MTREIKFRGKYQETKEWVYGYLYRDESGGTYIKPGDNNKRFGCGYPVIAATVGQYTGLKDKSSREIYEGDILSKILHPMIHENQNDYSGKSKGEQHKGIDAYYIAEYNPLCTGFELRCCWLSEIGVVYGSGFRRGAIAIGDRLPLSSIDGYTPKCNFGVIGNIHDNPELLKAE